LRIQEKPLARYPWYLRPFFWNQKRKYGQILKPGLLWGRVPRLFMAVAALYGVLDRKRSPIEPALRALVTVRVSQINWCRFCVDINSALLAERTGSTAKVEALENWRESAVFDEREKAVLTFAEAMTDSRQQVDDAMIVRLGEYFDEDGIVELTGLIAFQNLSSKFNAALDVEPQGFCKMPPPEN
jgi:AhpD family alkylhydroperoxidase